MDVTTGKFTKICSEENVKDTMHCTLYVKDKYSIADAGYHELSMLSDLPSSSQIKKLKHELNSWYNISKRHLATSLGCNRVSEKGFYHF